MHPLDSAYQFAQKWHNETKEQAEAQSFWNEFFAIFGIDRKAKNIKFEEHVKSAHNSDNRIDVYWKERLICEHKSAGRDLDAAFEQAYGYVNQLRERHEVPPRYILVSDFKHLRLYDLATLENGAIAQKTIKTRDLPKHLELFDFLHGYQTEIRAEEERINRQAALDIGALYHDFKLDPSNDPTELCQFMVRVLFCLFAEDTQIFPKYTFTTLVQSHSADNLSAKLTEFFQLLNQPVANRSPKLPAHLRGLEYINGNLFYSHIHVPVFSEQNRQTLLSLTNLDWSAISPEIFGTLFQQAMSADERRAGGAHYTDEKHIRKVIDSLFLNDLKSELARIVHITRKSERKTQLVAFQQKLSRLQFLDPACGSGNFLVVAYRELRLLELTLLTEYRKAGEAHSLVDVLCDVDQFHGIEIDPFSAEIAHVAMWLVDHQMNLKTSETLAQHYTRFPLRKEADIRCANALHCDWAAADYILGNPPFIGKTYQSKEQKADMLSVCKTIKNIASLDYVCAWYLKAAQIIASADKKRGGDKINLSKVAFVSTNSITQGEQVPILWQAMFDFGIHIHFAHRTFQWTSAAPNKAAVHCVIIGFALTQPTQPQLFDYADIQGEPVIKHCTNINPYLIDAPNVVIDVRKTVISGETGFYYGSKPTDGGHLLLSPEDKNTLIASEPLAQKYIRPFLGAEEFIHGKQRFCLWFADVDLQVLAHDLKSMPLVAQRIKAVKAMRLASSKIPTQKQAETPHLFAELRQPGGEHYLLIPRVSSETRQYIPIDYVENKVINGDANFSLPNATLYHFGILCSTMHNAFMRTVAGRLESRYRYANTIVYNNFPFPFQAQHRDAQAVKKIEKCAKAVLDAREYYRRHAAAQHLPLPSLADFYRAYDTINPYPNLIHAHHALDRAVDNAYGYTGAPHDSERVAFLFARYQQLHHN